MESNHYFPASMSLLIKVFTYVGGWGLAFCLLLVSMIADEVVPNLYGIWAIAAGYLLILVVVYLYRPLGYTVTESKILIKRPKGDIVIERADIASIEHFDAKAKENRRFKLASIRLFGSGGFYGGFGLFWNKAWGTFYGYITRADTLVLITPSEGKGRRVLISPDDPNGFIAATGFSQYTK